jgi:D-alanyl-D-alanine dipeptidase
MKPLNAYNYNWLTDDPDTLGVPVNFITDALPATIEPADMPHVAVPAPGDHEPMVAVNHRRVRVLSAYWHAGWDTASSGAFVREGVAERLYKAADTLPDSFGLAVFDAWRSLELQRAIFDAAYNDPSLPEGFVSVPSTNPATPPPHLTGGTVDVTLTWNSRPLRLGSDFDDFIPDARTDAFETIPGRVRQLRRLLFWSMYNAGFVSLDCEWWHFEHGTRRWAAATGNQPKYGAADIVLAERGRFTDRHRVVEIGRHDLSTL